MAAERLFPNWNDKRQIRLLQRIDERRIRLLQGRTDDVWRKYEPKLKDATGEKEDQILSEVFFEIEEFQGEINQIRTRQLRQKASNYLIDLDAIPVPDGLDHHWKTGSWGHRYLNDKSYDALSRALSDAEATHLRTRREVWEFRVKIVTSILTALTGVIGAIIGLLSVAKKK